MKRLALPVSISVSAGLLIAVVVQAAHLRRMEKKIAEIQRQVKQNKISSTRRRAIAEEEEGGVTADRNRVRPAEKRIPLAEEIPDVSRNAGEEGRGPLLTPEMKQWIEEVVEDKVVSEVKKQLPEKKEKKPPLREVAKELKLDPYTEAKMAEVLNGGKDQVFDLLGIVREDGGTFRDDFVDLLKQGKHEEAGGELWSRLMTEKIPGTSETYVSRIISIQKEVDAYLQTHLSTEQYQAYKHMGLDPLDIKTGHEPFADYLQQQGVEGDD